MFSIGMATPYFADLITTSGFLHFLLSIPSSILSYIVAIILGIFFIRLFFYILFASKTWKHKEKITFAELTKISEATNQKIPFFTILIPALDEADVIQNTILNISNINYPRYLYQLTIIVDEKERLKAQPGQNTTRAVVEQTIEKCRVQMPDFNLNFIEVPYDFDGKINGRCLGYEVPSTKGRGLNYALSHLTPETDFCAFFDAEASPNPDSFLAVAKHYLLDNQKMVFQLPVFQIRNFWSLSAFCKTAALGQCFSHQYALPFIFLFLPFVGGTNMFLHRSVIENGEGFDNNILTEDIEIGIRLYIDYKQWPVFLPYPSTEQTPQTRKAYHRQRYRWGYGFMQTLRKLFLELKDKNLEKAKRIRVKKMILSSLAHGPFDWIIYYPLTLAAALLFVLRIFKSIFASIILYRFSLVTVIPWNPINDALSFFIMFFPIPTLFFLGFLLKHYWKFINFYNFDTKNIRKQLGQWILFILFLAPLIASYYVFPYVHAAINFLQNPRQKKTWVKTKRTKEG
ncbi:MAG: glycosyltransferase [Parcubacteria group bacterium]|nr:glycosyltransferase [Parcubacteria group bacterium]